MLYCDYCSFYKLLFNMEGCAAKCEYTGYLFAGDIQELEIEYPCNIIAVKPDTKPLRLDDTHWKFNYMRVHTKPHTKRISA